MRTWPIYIICLVCGGGACGQQFPNIQFNYLTEKEGLSNNEVSSITQDEEGFMWIGTLDGLNRFDGYRVKHFFHNPSDNNSLVDNCVYRIAPGNDGQLWVTTREGLTVFDKKTGRFRNFRHNPSDTASLDNDQYAYIYLTKAHTAWLSTTSSLYYFDSSLHYKRVSTGHVNPEVDEPHTNLAYAGLYQDRQNRLWTSHFGYIFSIDPRTMHVRKSFGPVTGNVQSIYQSSDFQYWIGTFGGGLFRFDPSKNSITQVKLSNPANTIVYSIDEWQDKNNMRWVVVATDAGLVLVDPASLRNKEYNFHLGDFPQQPISQSVVSYVFVDRQNILWVGTEGGVCYAKPSRQLFDLWNISDSRETLPSTVRDWIYSISEVSDGYWMTRWESPGLFHFNKDGVLTRTVSSIWANHSAPLAESLKPYYVYAESDSVLWMTTDDYLVRYNTRSNKAVLYKAPGDMWRIGLRTILRVNDHCWWIRTRNNGPNGIYVFDPVKRQFTKHFSHSPRCDDCVPANLLTIFASRENEIYETAVGEGLFKYDAATDRFISIFKFKGLALRQHSNSFESIAEDNTGLLWITSYAGVFVYDPVSKKVVRDYTGSPVIGGVEVSGIIFDKQQNAWLNTQRGIYYILHSTGQVHELINTKGLRNNSNGTFQSGNDNAIYSGIQGYVVRVYPSQVLNHADQKVTVHFSDATVMDQPCSFRYTALGNKELHIKPSQNRFALDFSVMNYDGDNQYYYMLDGVMNTWQQNENGHLAFYNLSPGRYTLRVKGGNQNGDLQTNEDEVAIIVEPHWWQTKWFWLSCIVLVTSSAVFLIRRRIIQIRREALFNQKIAETEMMALRSQMNPHFIFNSLNSIENFMMQNEKRLASSYLNKFARLIRAILDSGRNELVPIAKDLEALRLYVDLEQLRYNHKFCFKLQVDPVLLNGDFKVPALLIQPYVENAIVHGVAHSEKQDLMLSVAANIIGENIHYKIQDNGIGRQLSSQYNLQNKPNHKSMGLRITEERIHIFNRKHHADGGVTITDLFDENNQPSGTRVDISIKAV